MSIEQATLDHLPSVVALARSWQLDNLPISEDRSQGFFIAGWELHEYQNFLDKAEYFYVVTEGAKLAGFGVAYSQRHAHLDPWLHRELMPHVAEYMLFEQLCIAPEWVGRGVGTSVMRHMLNLHGHATVISEVTREPLNEASVNMHKRLGFTPLLELTRPNGFPTTAWVLEAT
jgi:ribosomal protein S18 acetylase RimI-like enzyme